MPPTSFQHTPCHTDALPSGPDDGQWLASAGDFSGGSPGVLSFGLERWYPDILHGCRQDRPPFFVWCWEQNSRVLCKSTQYLLLVTRPFL